MNQNIPEDSLEQAYEVDGEMLTREQYDEQRRERLKNLHRIFSSQRDDWVKYRAQSGVEARWRQAQSLYFGDDESAGNQFEDILKNGPQPRRKAASPTRSRVVINIVRPKVDQAVARMCEILLPVDDKNWGISPTPVPESVGNMVGVEQVTTGPDGQPTGRTADQEAQIFIKQMKSTSAKMEDEIDDVLTECQYNGEQRKAIEDGVRLGVGMMLGPYPNHSSKRSWIAQPDGRMQLQIGLEVKPASMRVDPWDVWFDKSCGNDHQRGSGFYHRRYATKKELRALVGLPGYDEDMIREVLSTKPTRTKVAEGRVMRTACDEDSYEMWVYYGQVEADQMSMLSESMGDPLTDVEDGVVVMVDDKIIGAMESWVADGSLPIDLWCWRKADDMPQGFGLPSELHHQQRVINSAWRQVMDDAKASLGGQFVIKKKMITPQDGSYEMYPQKVWLASDELEDVRQAMHSFEFANHSQALLGIAAAAMQFADQETSMPQMMGGEKGTAPETVGGMIMLSNNSNTVLRLRVKLYDDSMTRPHIRRHFDWQMANSPKKEIKGDMEVDARGSTALIEKDVQNQAAINLAVVTNNPRYQPFIDPKEELRVILKAFKVTPEDIMLTDEQIKQNQKDAAQNPAPQDPRIVSAQMQLEGKQMDIADRKEQRRVDAQLQEQELAVKRESLAYTTERERSEAEQGQTRLMMDRELAIAQMQSDGIESQAERESKARMQAIDLSNKNALFNAEVAVKVNQGSGI